MSYLYTHEVWLCYLALSLSVLVFCIFIQWGKGSRAIPWVLGSLGIAALAIGILSWFLPGGRHASVGVAYTLLASVLGVMLNAARSLREERGHPDSNKVS